jgi:hypothetical protein
MSFSITLLAGRTRCFVIRTCKWPSILYPTHAFDPGAHQTPFTSPPSSYLTLMAPYWNQCLLLIRDCHESMVLLTVCKAGLSLQADRDACKKCEMIVPDRLSQVETRGEWAVCYIHRVLEPDGIQDGLFILRVMKWVYSPSFSVPHVLASDISRATRQIQNNQRCRPSIVSRSMHTLIDYSRPTI